MMKELKRYDRIIMISLIPIYLGLMQAIERFNGTVWGEILQVLSVIGYVVLAWAVFKRMSVKRLIKNKAGAALMVSFLFAFGTGVDAQSANYEKQVQALELSFENKNIEALKEYISSELAFGPIPVQNTPVILTNIVNNFPKLLELTIKETGEKEVLVYYNFEGMEEAESKIFFDESGKITKMEYFEEIIIQQIRAQQALQNSVQQPKPGELGEKYQPKSVEFKSKDGLLVSGNLYEINSNKPVILLLHQANYNKHEYADIAPKLNEMGYNVLAIDQRSGGAFAGKTNETFDRATQRGDSNISFVDAEQDIHAAIEYLHKKYNQKVTVWGSSYSSTLAIFEGAKNEYVNGIISFSPGNYFGDARPKLQSVFEKIDKPFLVTSSKAEAVELSKELEGIDLKKNQSQFIPESDGFHGSRAVWEGQQGAEEYWQAITEFLNKLYN
ncbi:MAG: alpha/beta hydrolase [Balneola sp.]